MEFHPLANLFPMMPPDGLQELAHDLKQHGQREPIVLFEGKVLDGRNRWQACQKAGISPCTREFAGDRRQAIDFVWSENFHRRHLSSSQSAMALAERKKLDPDFAAQVVEPLRKEACSATITLSLERQLEFPLKNQRSGAAVLWSGA